MKIEQKPTNKTTNKAGGGAFKMNQKEVLVSGILNSLFNEKKFYGDNTKELNDLAIQMLETNPGFVARLAVYAREKYNLRTFPTVLGSLIALHAPQYTEAVFPRIFKRPDQIREMVAFFNQIDPSGNLAKRGKSISGFKKLKKAVQTALNGFDEYQLQKWDSSDGITLKNVLRIFHPKLEKPEVGKMILDGTLPVAYTWETELSTKGNTRQVWEELIESKKLPYMAMLRNLRNIVKAGVSETHLDMVANFISNKEAVLKSKQFPYRFLSAVREMDSSTPRIIFSALNNAMEYSVENIEALNGRNIIAVDLSGSMNIHLSDKSKMTRLDVACYTAAILFKKYSNSVVIGFSNDSKVLKLNPIDSISTIADTISKSMEHSATNAHLVIDSIKSLGHKPDRVIFITDLQFWNSNPHMSHSNRDNNPFHTRWNEAKFDCWMHMIDLTGYGTHAVQTGKLNFMSGWSDSALSFISKVENGMDNLVHEIENLEL